MGTVDLLSAVRSARSVLLRDGGNVATMSSAHRWQAAGSHKSKAGGDSVFSELSVARLLFINQEELGLTRGVWESHR